MQTFLPYPDFGRSTRVLDPARLGKQRVEALQVLRGIALPSYGWQRHPAMQMWRGYGPALTRYALDAVDAWTDRGHADSIRPLIVEFAPNADGAPMSSLAVPSWFGDDAFHASHRSNLVRKWPEFYRPFFPEVADDLPYVWPSPDPEPESPPLDGRPIWVVRAGTEEESSQWVAAAQVSVADVSPYGRSGPTWRAQLDSFGELEEGATVAVLVANGSVLPWGIVHGPAVPNGGDKPGLRRSVTFHGVLARSEFPYPALLQDPRSLFATVGPP